MYNVNKEKQDWNNIVRGDVYRQNIQKENYQEAPPGLPPKQIKHKSNNKINTKPKVKPLHRNKNKWCAKTIKIHHMWSQKQLPTHTTRCSHQNPLTRTTKANKTPNNLRKNSQGYSTTYYFSSTSTQKDTFKRTTKIGKDGLCFSFHNRAQIYTRKIT